VLNNSGGAHFQSHFNFQDVAGQGTPVPGQEAGDVYVVPTTANEEAQVVVGQAFNFEYNEQFISRDGGPNFQTRVSVVIIVNADGTFTVSRSTLRNECRG